MSCRGVRGPHSALTDFLAEHGISAREIRERHEERQRLQQDQVVEEDQHQQEENQDENQNEPEATSPNTVEEATVPPATTRRLSRRTSRRLQTAETDVTSTTTTSLTVTADALTAIEVSQTEVRVESAETGKPAPKSAGRKTKRKKKESDDDFGDENFVPEKQKNARRSGARGGPSVAFCVRCRCRFSLTSSKTKGAAPQTQLCPTCAVDPSGDLPSPSGNVAPRRKRRKVLSKLAKDLAMLEDDNQGRIASLKNMCLAVIGDNIHDVEALGDLSQLDRDKLSRIISRHRELNNQTARLFLDAGETDLKLYDCTRLDAAGLSTIPMLAPYLTSLTLGYCGQLTGAVCDLIGSRLFNLTKLDLHGAFLVRSESWHQLLSSLPSLTSLSLAHCPRLDASALEGLSVITGLQGCRFADMSGVDDAALEVVTRHLKPHCLTAFELTRPANGENNTTSISSAVLLRLIKKLGPGLEELQLAECGEAVTGELLVDGIGRNCPRLVEIGLPGCEGISASALKAFFKVNAESVALMMRDEDPSEAGHAYSSKRKRRNARVGFERIDFSRLGVPTAAESGEANTEEEDVLDTVGLGGYEKRGGHGINGSVLADLSRHSSQTLVELNINGADALEHGLCTLFDPDFQVNPEDVRVVLPSKPKNGSLPSLPQLRLLDISWIRAIDDDTLERLGTEAPQLEQAVVWGCHRVTDCAKIPKPDGRFARIVGRERDAEAHLVPGR